MVGAFFRPRIIPEILTSCHFLTQMKTQANLFRENIDFRNAPIHWSCQHGFVDRIASRLSSQSRPFQNNSSGLRFTNEIYRNSDKCETNRWSKHCSIINPLEKKDETSAGTGSIKTWSPPTHKQARWINGNSPLLWSCIWRHIKLTSVSPKFQKYYNLHLRTHKTTDIST